MCECMGPDCGVKSAEIGARWQYDGTFCIPSYPRKLIGRGVQCEGYKHDELIGELTGPKVITESSVGKGYPITTTHYNCFY